MKPIKAFAPGRVCFVGEDIDWISGPSILCAINLGVTVSIESNKLNSRSITLITGDPFNTTETILIKNIGKYRRSVLDYTHAAINVFMQLGIKITPITIRISSTLPAKAGLASSAAVTVATLKALSKYYNTKLDSLSIANLAYEVERRELKTGAGQMDMYSSAMGNLIYINSSTTPPNSITKLSLPDETDIIVVDSLTPRSTKEVIRKKRKRFYSKEPCFLRYVSNTKNIIKRMKKELQANLVNEKQIGKLISCSHYQIKNNLKVSTKLIDDCIKISLRNGALGAKLTGTGMGGCMFALTKKDNTKKILTELSKKQVKIYVAKISNIKIQ
jgi:mevalonate kinase